MDLKDKLSCPFKRVRTFIRRVHHIPIDDPVNDQYQSALHVAVKKGDENKTLELLKKGADPNLPDLEYARTLHMAVENGHVHLIPLLVKYGADLELQTHEGYRPIHTLMKSPKKIECLDQLCALGADINRRDSTGNSILFLYLKSDIEEIQFFKKLLHYGANVHNRDSLKSNGLHILAVKLKINSYLTKVLAESLIAEGINVNAKDFFGDTPLHLASCYGNNAQLLNILLRNNARLDIPNDKLLTPFELAVECQNSTAIFAMLKHALLNSHRDIPNDEKMMQNIYSDLEIRVWYEAFEQELNGLKEKKIFDFTVYDILCKNVEEIVDCTRDTDSLLVLSSPFIVSSNFNREIVSNWNEAKRKIKDEPFEEFLI